MLAAGEAAGLGQLNRAIKDAHPGVPPPVLLGGLRQMLPPTVCDDVLSIITHLESLNRTHHLP
jgi:hypothetical protein